MACFVFTFHFTLILEAGPAFPLLLTTRSRGAPSRHHAIIYCHLADDVCLLCSPKYNGTPKYYGTVAMTAFGASVESEGIPCTGPSLSLITLVFGN